uniref:Uncharacterized protein n=1 Tax=Schistocephalus solidus TaxID=70667 RepID=A0A0X3PPS3_SCHSO
MTSHLEGIVSASHSSLYENRVHSLYVDETCGANVDRLFGLSSSSIILTHSCHRAQVGGESDNAADAAKSRYDCKLIHVQSTVLHPPRCRAHSGHRRSNDRTDVT